MVENPVIIVDGDFRLKDSSYVFIKQGKKIKVIKANTIRSGEKIVFCNLCKTVPAFQLDHSYADNIHDFTLCQFCLAEDGVLNTEEKL